MIYIFFHNDDLDGHCSGAIANYYFCKAEQKLWKNDKVVLEGLSHGDSFDMDRFKKEDKTYFLDFTLPGDEMYKLKEKCQVFIIDHHFTSKRFIDDFDGNIKPENTKAGCELAWEYFFQNIEIPIFVKYLSLYDIWNKSKDWDEKILPFQYGMRVENTDILTDMGAAFWWTMFALSESNTDACVGNIIEKGKTILSYEKRRNEISIKNSFDIEFEGLRMLAIIGSGKGSEFFKSKWNDEKYDAMMSIMNVRNEYWAITLYTNKDLNLTPIAKKYGGGGHKTACGFQVKQLGEIL